MFTNKVNAALFGVGKEKLYHQLKEFCLIKEFEEALEGCVFVPVDQGPKSLS